MNDHRWSGWPGAWCLDCGIPDMLEACLREGHPDDCEICENPECLAPGSRLHDPYSVTFVTDDQSGEEVRE